MYHQKVKIGQMSDNGFLDITRQYDVVMDCVYLTLHFVSWYGLRVFNQMLRYTIPVSIFADLVQHWRILK
jgi:hypothetical protein